MIIVGITGCFIYYLVNGIGISLIYICQCVVDSAKDYFTVNGVSRCAEYITCGILQLEGELTGLQISAVQGLNSTQSHTACCIIGIDKGCSICIIGYRCLEGSVSLIGHSYGNFLCVSIVGVTVCSFHYLINGVGIGLACIGFVVCNCIEYD